MEAQDSSPGVRPGDLLAGKYRVERVLGAGGMGVVVAARHLRLDELVAIKFLLPNKAQNPETVARFAREARAASKLKGEHVARVTDVDTMPDGSAYMVMEFLEGQDLTTLLQTRGTLPIEEAVGYALDVCEAMVEAHALGIIHRDLKPDNLFVAERAGGGSVLKVLDFGISKLVGPMAEAGGGGLTTTQAVVGSPHYMSPEQLVASRTVDFRTDVWSLGVTLYELLTRALPFRGESMPEICSLIMFSPPEAPSTHRSDMPAELDAIVMRCLEKDREQRFASMAELAAGLAPFGSAEAGAWVSRVVSGPPASRTSSPSTRIRHSRTSQDGSTGTDPTVRAESPTFAATALTRSHRAEPSRARVAAILAGAVAVGAMGVGLWRAVPLVSAPQAASAPVTEHAPPIAPSASSATEPAGSATPLASASSTAAEPGAGAGHPPAAGGAASASSPAFKPPPSKSQRKGPRPVEEEDTIGF